LSIRANIGSKPLSFVDYTLLPNLSLTSLDTCSQQNEKLVKQYNGSKSMAIYWNQNRYRQHNKLQKIVLSKNKKHLASTRIASDNVITFQMQNVEDDKIVLFLDNNRIIFLRSLYNNRESNSNSIIFTSNNVSNDTYILKCNSQSLSLQDEDKPSQEKLQFIVDCLSQDVCHMIYKIFKN